MCNARVRPLLASMLHCSDVSKRERLASERACVVFHLIGGVTEHTMLSMERVYPEKLWEGVPHRLGGSIEGEGCGVETRGTGLTMRVVEWVW